MKLDDLKRGDTCWLATGSDTFKLVKFGEFAGQLQAAKVYKGTMKRGHDWKVLKSELRTKEQMQVYFNAIHPRFVPVVKPNLLLPRRMPKTPPDQLCRKTVKELCAELAIHDYEYAPLLKKARECGLIPPAK